jgi:hypothetical protein
MTSAASIYSAKEKEATGTMTVVAPALRAVDRFNTLLKETYAVAAAAEEEEEAESDVVAETVCEALWMYLLAFVSFSRHRASNRKAVNVMFRDTEEARLNTTSFCKVLGDCIARLKEANVRNGIPTLRHDLGYVLDKIKSKKMALRAKGDRVSRVPTRSVADDACLVAERRVRREIEQMLPRLDDVRRFFEESGHARFVEVPTDAHFDNNSSVLISVQIGSHRRYCAVFEYTAVPEDEATSTEANDVALKRLGISREAEKDLDDDPVPRFM